MNSLKSLCSFTARLRVFCVHGEEHVEALLGRQGSIVVRLGVVSVLEAIEDCYRPVHCRHSTAWSAASALRRRERAHWNGALCSPTTVLSGLRPGASPVGPRGS